MNRSRFGRKCLLDVAILFGLWSSLAWLFYLPPSLLAQTMSSAQKSMTSATNPANPIQPVLVPNLIHNPNGYVMTGEGDSGPLSTDGGEMASTMTSSGDVASPVSMEIAANDCASPWWVRWSGTFSTLYGFSSQRSTVGDAFLNINYVGIDFNLSTFSRPYTSFDFIYLYSHGSGSAAGGTNEVLNQYLGGVRIVQPLNVFWCSTWKPAGLSKDPTNEQLAIIMESVYGGAFGSITAPNVPLQHFTQQPFVQDALLDYQRAIFPQRSPPLTDGYGYPNWLIEFGTGVQFTRLGINSSRIVSSNSSSDRQLDYLNFASLSYSFSCGWGVLVGVEWDAPLDSVPIHNSKPYYANTAIFTAGLVYNLYVDKGTKEGPADKSRQGLCDPKRWSLSLLYSHTAFDPSTQTNTVQLQISYSLF